MVESVRATSEARIWFVCSPKDRDAIVECNQTGEPVLVASWQPGKGDFAAKINMGFRQTQEEFVFCGATDLKFWPQWEQQALTVAERSNAGVIGTQDKGNALVKRGVHSTHPLVRRSYIDEYGTWDGTGEVYCELYDHQYVDLELVETAKMRGQWAFAKRSVVEHLHPVWGKGVQDETYTKAFRSVTSDRALYQRRMRRYQQLCRRQRAAL